MISLEDIKNTNIGISLNSPGLGDNLILSHLPENFFKNTGKKLITNTNHPIFQFNPYVDNTINPDIWITSQEICEGGSNLVRNIKKINPRHSIASEHCHFFSLPKCYLRHSRLYIHEDIDTKQNKVCVHTTGKSIGGTMSDKVISIIKENYKNYHLVQIGGNNDKKIDFAEDKTGLNLFETAKEIAESAIFIGIDSSQLHIANCYPKVRKKLLINYFNEDQFEKLSPLYGDAAWWDFNIETYNNYEYDIGCSMSFLKI